MAMVWSNCVEHSGIFLLSSIFAIEIPGKICGFDRDCFVASLLAMTRDGCICHCEERSDEAISKPQLFTEVSIANSQGGVGSVIKGTVCYR